MSAATGARGAGALVTQAWRRPPLLQRLAIDATLRRDRLAVRALAMLGDPVAQFVGVRPEDDVYAIHERIRARGPVTRSRLGVHAVTSRELCDAVLRDPRWSAADAGGAAVGEARQPIGELALGPLSRTFLELDPPDHTRLRRIAAPAFRPRAMRAYAGRVEALADQLADGLVDTLHRHGEADLMADFAGPFPIAVISDLLRVPDVDTERFTEIGRVIARSLDGVQSTRHAEQISGASVELAELFVRMAAERSGAGSPDADPDVVALLAAARSAGVITERELVATCALLLLAGFETTVNLIGNAMSVLLADRVLWQRLGAEPDLAARVVEETLRHDPPVQGTSRIATEDVEVAGVRLPRGATLLTLLAAANRDPAVYHRPARFDPDRHGEPEHLAFSSGIHYCLGAPLARIEAAAALRVLARRLPELHQAGAARRRPGMTIRGFSRFPVTIEHGCR